MATIPAFQLQTGSNQPQACAVLVEELSPAGAPVLNQSVLAAPMASSLAPGGSGASGPVGYAT